MDTTEEMGGSHSFLVSNLPPYSHRSLRRKVWESKSRDDKCSLASQLSTAKEESNAVITIGTTRSNSNMLHFAKGETDEAHCSEFQNVLQKQLQESTGLILM